MLSEGVSGGRQPDPRGRKVQHLRHILGVPHVRKLYVVRRSTVSMEGSQRKTTAAGTAHIDDRCEEPCIFNEGQADNG